MIVLKVHPPGIAILPLEGDTPRTVDMHAVPFRLTSQSVEVEAGNFKVSRSGGCVQNVQPELDAICEFRCDPTRVSSVKVACKAAMPEILNHAAECIAMLYSRKDAVYHDALRIGDL